MTAVDFEPGVYDRSENEDDSAVSNVRLPLKVKYLQFSGCASVFLRQRRICRHLSTTYVDQEVDADQVNYEFQTAKTAISRWSQTWWWDTALPKRKRHQ